MDYGLLQKLTRSDYLKKYIISRLEFGPFLARGNNVSFAF